LKLVVRDRIGRGGPTFSYRLKIKSAEAGFQLLAEPENFTIPRTGSADLTVFLVREPGFEDEVEVWVEGLPSGVEAPSGRFRADQFFGPSADGDNIIIPELTFRIEAPGNDIRRPIPQIAVNVVEPFEARLSTEARSVRLDQGSRKEVKIAATQIPEDAKLRLAGAPPGIDYQVVAREADQIVLKLAAADNAKPGTAKISFEADVAGRWAATAPIELVISEAKSPHTASR
jgi:hypothetical protein